MTETPIDAAHAGMDDSDAARLRFFERLADAELFLLLAKEPQGDDISPEVFDTGDGRFVLAFDLEERLTAFVGRPSPYVAMSGRLLAGMLAGQGIGLALNPEVAPSSILIPAEGLTWLAETLAQVPDEASERPVSIDAPRGLPQELLTALDAKLASAAGLARFAYLVSAVYAPSRPGHLLAFIDVAPGAEGALARAAGEALTFSGIEAGALDVAFFAASDPMAARLARVGLRFDLPERQRALTPQPPGSDPSRPPRLR